MRIGEVLAKLREAPVVDLETLTGGRGLVVVAPHPDDESLGCGGLIAEAVSRGSDVRLIVVSDGCGSHTASKMFPPPALRALREAETLEAAGRLGLDAARVGFLRLPDAAVPSQGPGADAAAASLAEAARSCGAGALFVSWRHDPHCDHEAAAAIADLARQRLEGVRVYAYPVWGWVLPEDSEVTAPAAAFRLDVRERLAAKRAAIAAHLSQTTGLIADDPGGFRLDPAMIDRLCGPFEHFIEDTR